MARFSVPFLNSVAQEEINPLRAKSPVRGEARGSLLPDLLLPPSAPRKLLLAAAKLGNLAQGRRSINKSEANVETCFPCLGGVAVFERRGQQGQEQGCGIWGCGDENEGAGGTILHRASTTPKARLTSAKVQEAEERHYQYR
ncbi:hypothetical protein E2C01_010587 [Portunus trituberculatus]|uniref:Uncharacterized protein n=1 Tax=Portunus trituberculatus TaxID=210409 RepID=A0A5B7D919_PORTR|nr:hypothetical protein [Portunus trituberculatus]